MSLLYTKGPEVSIQSYELMEVISDNVTADLIVWFRYKMRAPGIVEAMLDYNPQLSLIHRTSPFIPPGTYVMVPIDTLLLSSGASLSNPANANLWLGQSG
jgi:hypothetical protein